MSKHPPTITEAKSQAKKLRASLAAQNMHVTHAKALETVAQLHGFRDWNAFHAAHQNRPPDGWVPNGRVEGYYLSKPFQATVLASKMLSPGWFRLELDLDEPLDVVTFDSFSAYRKRIRAVAGPDGRTRERTSDGVPHLQLKM